MVVLSKEFACEKRKSVNGVNVNSDKEKLFPLFCWR